MAPSSRSLYYFAIYLLLAGFALIALPQVFFSTLQLPEIPRGWSTVLGSLVLIIGIYEFIGSRNNLLPVIRGSVYARGFFFLMTAMLYVSDQMPAGILVLGLIDAIGALWTWLMLRKETSA